MSSDGNYAHCSREQGAGLLEENDHGLYAHRLGPKGCRCGNTHDGGIPAIPAPRPRDYTAPAPDYTQYSQPVAVYSYTTEYGEVLYQALRYEPKRFAYRVPHGDGGYVWNLEGVTERVLYRIPEWEGADPDRWIFLAEGERDADRLVAAGLLATTNCCGALSWRPEYTQALAGRRVVILEDNDNKGRARTELLRTALAGASCAVKVVQFTELPEGGDVSDYLDRGNSVQHFLDTKVAGAQTILATGVPMPGEIPVPGAPRPPQDDIPVAPNSRFKTLGINELGQMRPARWLIEGVLEEQSVVLVFGEPGQGKSFVVLDWSLCLASGENWFGRAARRGRVVYVAAENAYGYASRVRAWMLKRHVQPELLTGFSLVPTPVNLLSEADITGLEATLGSDPISLIVFDTLARSMAGGDENLQGDMTRVMLAARRLAEKYSATVILVHHSSKGNPAVSRGSSVINGDIDSEIFVSKPGDVVLHCKKMRNGQPFDDINLTLKIANMDNGVDPEEGTMTSTCYLSPAKEGANSKNLSREERIVLTALCQPPLQYITLRELMIVTSLDERSLFLTLRKLSYAGLVDHEGWPKSSARRYWIRQWGADSVGKPMPVASESPAPLTDEPWEDCPQCGAYAWSYDAATGNWHCGDCSAQLSTDTTAA